MPRFEEIVEVRGRQANGSAALVDLAKSVSAGSGGTDEDQELKVASWMTWQHMLGEAQATPTELAGVEDGATWLEWRGTLRGVVRDLQLGGVTADSDTLDTLRDRISRWLRMYGNAQCINWNTSGTGKAEKEVRWAIRSEFRESPPERGVVRLKQYMTGQATLSAPDRDEPRAETGGAAASAGKRITCKYCPQDFAAVYLARHVFSEHIDPLDLLSDVLQRRGEAQTTELVGLLREAVGSDAITTLYLAKIMQPLVTAGTASARHGWGGDYSYIWTGPPAQPGSDGVVITNTESTPAPAPVQAPAPSVAPSASAATMGAGFSAASLTVPRPKPMNAKPPVMPVKPAEPPAPAPTPAPVAADPVPAGNLEAQRALMTLHAAINGAEDALEQVGQALLSAKSAVAALEASVPDTSQLDEEVARLRAENEQLEAFRRRVQDAFGR